MAPKSISSPPQGASQRVAHVGIFDFTGAFREKRIDGAAFDAALANGWRFIDALPYWLYDETCFAERGFVDEAVAIDPDSIRPYPFEPEALLAVADYAGPSAAISPRAVLRSVCDSAAAQGFRAVGGFEYEVIFLNEDGASLRSKGWNGLQPALPHNRCWSGVAPAADAGVLAEIHDDLRAAGITLDHHCMELGPGCVEYCLGPEPLLRAADDAALFKVFTKALARRRNWTASFLAQLDQGFPGLGGHLSLSLVDEKTGQSAFAGDAGGDGAGLSDIGRAFLGGVVALTPDLMCLFAPTMNAYRRLRPGNWAPRAANWGVGNYSCGVRVVPGVASASTPATPRLEFRLPGSDAAAHMVAAMFLGAGLWGIANNADPGPACDGNGRLSPVSPDAELPRSLNAAADRLLQSKPARAIFGDTFVDHYAAWCRAESDSFLAHVSAFERARYLETL